ncbi:hypothetical protein MANES_01G123701v8 [Manihot esculenta]|uniref:Uncharacterized protein n=1 Tax=Manihot esculenta TaxID=3983 RepID=A0ACB7IEC8_MANES|nr:hypothetical protein MANES_01G123701v8 [Manihot esculenta]
MEAHLDALDLWEAVEKDYEIKNHKEKKTKKSKAKNCLFSIVSNTIFTRIMPLKTTKEFELQRMKESKTTKEYSERLLDIVNKVRLLDTTFDDSIIIQKNKSENSKEYPLCKHCGKTNHSPFKYWRRPDAKCKKCNQLGHEAVICKNKKQEAYAQVVDQDEEDQIFVATCFSTGCNSECWLIDIGCTNHMTYDKTLFKDLNLTEITKVRIGNGVYIPAKGKGTIVIITTSGIKTISEIFCV